MALIAHEKNCLRAVHADAVDICRHRAHKHLEPRKWKVSRHDVSLNIDLVYTDKTHVKASLSVTAVFAMTKLHGKIAHRYRFHSPRQNDMFPCLRRVSPVSVRLRLEQFRNARDVGAEKDNTDDDKDDACQLAHETHRGQISVTDGRDRHGYIPY